MAAAPRPSARWWGDRDRSQRLVLLAVVTGFALRLAWVSYAARDPLGLFDPARYHGFADLLADGEGYVQFTSGEPTAYYPPGYPFFLGGVEWLSRHTPIPGALPTVAGVAQALLGAITIALGAFIARRLHGATAAVITAFVLALYPNLVFHSAALLSETLYNALFLASIAVLVRRPWSEGLPAGRLVAAAVPFAAAVLVRPISLAVVPMLGLAWWIGTRRLRPVVVGLAIFTSVVVALVAPWTIRNAVQMDAFVPISTNTGDNLCIGHQPDASGVFAFSPACDTGESAADSAAAEVRHDRETTDRAFEFIRQDPLAEIPLTWHRLRAMFDGDHDALAAVQSFRTDDFIPEGRERLLSTGADAFYVVVLVVGLAGMVLLCDRRRPERLMIVLSAAATLVVPLAFFGEPRFKVPAMPLFAIAAAVAVATFAERVGRHR